MACIAYLLGILRRDVVVLMPKAKLPNVLLNSGLGEY
jgi:hypothetical protein